MMVRPSSPNAAGSLASDTAAITRRYLSGTDPPSWPHAGAVAAAASVVLAIYVLRIDRVAGLVVDDAWYVLLARGAGPGRWVQTD